MTTNPKHETRLPVVASMVALSGALSIGCDAEPLEPGTAGCMFDQAAVTECTIAVLEISGGIAGVADEYVIRDDGTVKYVNRLTGASQERALPGGADRAAQLADALDASHVRDVEAGCYLPSVDVADGLNVRVTLHEDGRLWFFGSDCENGPSELLDVIDILKAYVQEAL
ncbi:MAG: hypothetical protein HY907_00410 [Deltaproteobacteria bacterium]|nr:hypothetical protein [Deltaproteobacteria bacterium]